MRNRWQRWACTILISGIGGLLMANGCLINAQRELDLLWAPDANIDYARQSWLVKTFGPGILNFW